MRKEITLETFKELAKAGINENYVLTDHYLAVEVGGKILNYLKDHGYNTDGEIKSYCGSFELHIISINRK